MRVWGCIMAIAPLLLVSTTETYFMIFQLPIKHFKNSSSDLTFCSGSPTKCFWDAQNPGQVVRQMPWITTADHIVQRHHSSWIAIFTIPGHHSGLIQYSKCNHLLHTLTLPPDLLMSPSPILYIAISGKYFSTFDYYLNVIPWNWGMVHTHINML